MIIDFLGDSITIGAGAEVPANMFTAILCKKLGAVEKNYGLPGTRIARQRIPSPDPHEDQDYLSRVAGLDPQADLVIVFGGTNDYGHGDAVLGRLGDKDPYTFYGAANLLCAELLKRFSREKIVFILPLPRYDETNLYGERKKTPAWPLEAYREALREVLDQYRLPYADFSKQLPASTSPHGDQLHMDGLHPNIAGHALLAQVLYQYLKETGKVH
jgi:lysophospholipase L1-like esterase